MRVPEIVVTSADYEKLQAMLETHGADRDYIAVSTLEEELSRARIVSSSEIPSNIVTMNSSFRYVDRDTGESRTVQLVYPEHADYDGERLSVLAPVGCALLGLAVGQTMECCLPYGTRRSFTIEEILFQPQASGEKS
jgi:regulator of nucleoside diphosphate kinase